MDIKEEIAHNLRRESEERQAVIAATSTAVHDAHFVLAERYADKAYSLTEQLDQQTHDAAMKLKPKLRIVI